MDRDMMVETIVRFSQATANPVEVRNYYTKKSLIEVEQDYKALIENETRRITSANAEVQKAHADAQAAKQARDRAYSDMIWSQITNVVINGMQADATTANRNIISGWLHDGEVASGEWFRKIIVEEQAALARRISWHAYINPQVEAQQSKENDARTLSVFFDLARRLNISHSQANQASVLAAYPEGVLDANQLEQDIRAGKIVLHAAGATEAEQFNKELVKAHNLRWQQVTKNMSVAEIKQVSAQERSEREQLTNRITPETKAPVGITPLPASITREILLEKLNSDRAAIHLWSDRYGIAAVNSRLQGLN